MSKGNIYSVVVPSEIAMIDANYEKLEVKILFKSGKQWDCPFASSEMIRKYMASMVEGINSSKISNCVNYAI